MNWIKQNGDVLAGGVLGMLLELGLASRNTVLPSMIFALAVLLALCALLGRDEE